LRALREPVDRPAPACRTPPAASPGNALAAREVRPARFGIDYERPVRAARVAKLWGSGAVTYRHATSEAG